jgi:hypothetical protein
MQCVVWERGEGGVEGGAGRSPSPSPSLSGNLCSKNQIGTSESLEPLTLCTPAQHGSSEPPLHMNILKVSAKYISLTSRSQGHPAGNQLTKLDQYGTTLLGGEARQGEEGGRNIGMWLLYPNSWRTKIRGFRVRPWIYPPSQISRILWTLYSLYTAVYTFEAGFL